MRHWLFSVLLLPGFAASAVESGFPSALPSSRYAPMVEQSPFALATVVEAPTAPKESFAANWELTGLAKSREADGTERDFVTIRSRDRRISFSLSGDEVSHDPDAEGVSISAVEWNPGNRKSTVTLKKGTEFAKVEFGQETTPPPAPPMAAGNQMNRAGMPNVPMPAVQPNYSTSPNQVGANRVPGIVRPNVPQAGVITPPKPQVYPQAAPPNMNQNNGRRVRVINTKP